MTLVLQWIKSHLIIVIMIAICVIIPPIIIIAASEWNSSIAEEIKKRATEQAMKLKSVEHTRVEIKPLEPGVKAVDETRVINDAVLADYTTAREAISADAKGIEAAALKANKAGKEAQLVPGLLPAPAKDLAEELPYKLHDAYIAAHNDLLSQLNAGMPPTPDAVTDQLMDFNANFRRSQLNAGPSDALNESDQKKLNEAMTRQRLALYAQVSSEFSVYADLSVFNLQPWDNTHKPDDYRWYEWQMTYWLDMDLAHAINRANHMGSDRTTIIGEPGSIVKRIIAIMPAPIFPANLVNSSGNSQFGGPAPMGSRGSEYAGGDNRGMQPLSPRGGEGGPPMGKGVIMTPHGPVSAPSTMGTSPSSVAASTVGADTFSTPDVEFPLDFSNSITGRFYRTGLYDSRLVNVSLIIDSNRMQQLFDAINTTDFMTVTEMSVMGVDVEGELGQGFYYGSEPIVQVNMTIETLWMRDWTKDLMPPPVKDYFGIKSDQDSKNGTAGDSGEQPGEPAAPPQPRRRGGGG